MKKLKRILKAISRRKRQERLKRNYKKYSLQIPRLMKSETTMELDFAAAEIASAEVRKRQKAEETIEEMKAGFRELERVFGDLPPEIVSLYRIPDRKG